ncbi:MAG: lipoprotein LpqH [Mycobacterium sp.]
MRTRLVAAAVIASVLVVGSSGCSQGAAKVPQKTARVTVNGHTSTSHAVSCTQVQWLLTVDISAGPGHVRAVLQLDPHQPKMESVNIDNFNGFSGVADAGVGKAEVTFAGDTYHITGAAPRTNPENPVESSTAPFTIDTTC